MTTLQYDRHTLKMSQLINLTRPSEQINYAKTVPTVHFFQITKRDFIPSNIPLDNKMNVVPEFNMPPWVFKVVMIHHRSVNFLDIGLESLKNQTYHNFDVIMADDDSGPPFVDEIKELGHKYQDNFNISIVFGSEQVGQIGNIIRAIKTHTPNDEDVVGI